MILNIHFEEAEKLFLAALANMFASQLPHRRKDFGDQKFVKKLRICTYEKYVESCKIICNKVLVQIWTSLIWSFGSKKGIFFCVGRCTYLSRVHSVSGYKKRCIRNGL